MTIEEQATSGPGRAGAQGRRRTRRWRGATSSACGGWRTSPSGARDPRRRRRRRRAQRPGRRQPPGRPRLVGARARGPARGRRRRPQRRGRAPGLRARHVQRLLPARRRVADDPRRSGSRSTACAGATRRPCSATRCPTAAGRCCTATGRSRPPGSTSTTPATARRGWSCARTGTGSATTLIDGLLTPVPAGPRRRSGCWPGCPRVGGLGFVRDPAHARRRARAAPASAASAPRLLLAGNAGHADIPLDAPGSGLMALLMTMLGQTVGFPAPEGGAGELTAALARRLTGLGGEVRCSAEVVGSTCAGGRATGVRTARRRAARGAPRGRRRRRRAQPVRAAARLRTTSRPGWPAGMRSFQLDPATVKVDWALERSGPLGVRAGARSPARSTSPTPSRR